MSASDYTYRDLAIIGDDCLRIHIDYRANASDNLVPLLSKFKILSELLRSLSEIMQTSGRPLECFDDPDLDGHIKDAQIEFQKHFEVRRKRKKLERGRIRKLDSHINGHISKAKEFRTDILLNAVLDKLGGRQQGIHNSGRNGTITDDGTASNEPDSLTHEALARNSRAEDDSASVLSDFTGVVNLARIMFENAANQHLPQRRPIASSHAIASAVPLTASLSMRNQFVHDVEKAIMDTRLYAEDTVPQEAHDKMSEIVTKATRLKITLPPPELNPLQTGPDSLSREAPAMCMSGSSPSAVASSDSHSEVPFRPLSIEEVDVVTDRQVLNQEDQAGWVKICSPQTELNPTLCTLEISKSEGGVYIDAYTIPGRTTAAPNAGSTQPGEASTPSTSFERSPDGHGNLAFSRTFRHFFAGDARPIPFVCYPHHEGPTVTPSEPYTIAFKGGTSEPSRQVADLKYIFSDKKFRDHVRSLLFGKELLESIGVKKIVFHSIACERQAVSLWFDASKDQKTITFFRDRHPHGQVEYEVVGIEEHKNGEDNEKPLVLFVKLLPYPETPERPPRRASSILSRRSGRSKTSAPVNRCSLLFSEMTGKKTFLNTLERLYQS